MYPTGASSLMFYWLPQTHKKDIPLRPIVSSIGSVTYGVELAGILKPPVGITIYNVDNSKAFVGKIKNTKLEKGECITSYDVTSLFTAVPVSSAIDIIKNRLELDTELPYRTIMSDNNTIELLGFCPNNTYFLF